MWKGAFTLIVGRTFSDYPRLSITIPKTKNTIPMAINARRPLNPIAMKAMPIAMNGYPARPALLMRLLCSSQPL